MQLDVLSILTDLGVEVYRESGDELLGRCPLHAQRTGKEDSHPSWSINQETMVHHCFSCGYSGTLTSLYRDLMGEVPDDLEWELKKQSALSGVKKIEKNDVVEADNEGPVINEWTLKSYSEVSERMLDTRHLKSEAARAYGVKWNKDYRSWVLPIRTPDGTLIGYQFKYSGGFDNYPKEIQKSHCLFGFPLHQNESRITVVESPLDAVRLYGLGIPAVSTYGASVSDQQVQLLARNYTTVVLAMDNDDPGRRSNDYLASALRGKASTVRFDYRGHRVKDPGEFKSDAALLNAWYNSTRLQLEHTP